MSLREIRTALADWNRNQPEAFRKVWEWLASTLKVHPAALGRLSLPSAEPLSGEGFERLQYLVQEDLDNALNSGDAVGGQLWKYVELVSPGVASRPSGAEGERLHREVTGGRMKRRYRWPHFFMLDRAAGVTLSFDLREPEDTRRLARALLRARLRFAGKDALRQPVSESLEALREVGWEPAVEERGFRKTEERLSPGTPGTLEEMLVMMTPTKLHQLAQASAERLAEAQRGCRGASTAWQLMALTQSFLAWWIEGCGARATEQSSPELRYSIWLARQLAVDQEPETTRAWDGLRERLRAQGWSSFHRTAKTPLPPPSIDAERWKNRILDAEPAPYEEWHEAVMNLVQGSRNAIDRAKSRAELAGILDEFYILLAHVPADRRNSGGHNDSCKRIRDRFRRFLEGDIEPEEGMEYRSHVDACCDCYWAFSDYVRDRVAWGYRPQPLVAMLRERLRSLDATSLRAAIGSLPVDPGTVLAAACRPGQQRRSASLAPAIGHAPRHATSRWPHLRPGESVCAEVFDAEGSATGRSARISLLDTSIDPVSREASLTVRVEGASPDRGLLAAQTRIDESIYSLAGDIQGGCATLRLEVIPPNLDDLCFERWCVLEA